MYCARRLNDALQRSAGGLWPTNVLDITCNAISPSGQKLGVTSIMGSSLGLSVPAEF